VLFYVVESTSTPRAVTREEADWQATKALGNIRSWIAVPLVVGDSVLGLLSIATTRPRALSTEHFRMAKSLAIPAAVPIQNARLYGYSGVNRASGVVAGLLQGCCGS
jgi:GAF domain-containing protein